MRQPYISRLPNELLLFIFELLVELDPVGEAAFEDDDDDDDASDTTSFTSDDADETYSYTSRSDLCPGYSLGFMRITHVCHSWRELALGVPALWTTIPLWLCSDWMDALVQRSGGMLLDVLIHLGVDAYRIEERLERIGPSRVRRIYSENKTFDALWALELSGIEMPSLEELDYDHITRLCKDMGRFFPALRKLTLNVHPDRLPLPSSSSSQALGLSKHLTELTLRTPYDTFIPFSHRWFDVISNLTVLHLQLVCFVFDSNGHNAPSVVELPRLKELLVVETGANCGAFLRRVSIPSSARCNQQFIQPTDTLHEARVLESLPYFQAIENAFRPRPLSLLALAHFSFNNGGSSVLSAHGWRNVPNGTDGAPSFNIEAERMFAHDADVAQTVETHRTFSFAGFTPMFLCRPYFSTLVMLALDIDPHPEYSLSLAWRNALGSMAQLRHLRVSSPYSERQTPLNILQALLPPKPGDDAVVPLLDSLTLVDWDPDVDGQGCRIDSSPREYQITEASFSTRRDFPGAVVRAIMEDRTGVLRTVYLKNWRRDYNAEWRAWMRGSRGAAVVYEEQFLSLDRVHATEDMDQGYDFELPV